MRLDPELTQAAAVRGLIRIALDMRDPPEASLVGRALKALPPDSPGAKELQRKVAALGR
jgi:hypothetical protein